MNELGQLRHQVYATTHTPRELLVTYIKALAEEAKQLPATEREATGDYTDPNSKFPQTKGEDIASDILTCILQQDWISYDTAEDLEDISEIAINLERNTDDQDLWQELFEKVSNLR